MSTPRAVVVWRKSEYEELLIAHSTPAQAGFYLKSRGMDLDITRTRYHQQEQALNTILSAIPSLWRRSRVDRQDLDRFPFEPEDVIVAVGQDGLVANVARFLQGQRVIGVNPEPERIEGVLVRYRPEVAAKLLAKGVPVQNVQKRTMVEARLDDGQVLTALNEVFFGHASHQSARYQIHWDGKEELHSSSGVLVSTGTGASGWARSIHRDRKSKLPLPKPEDPNLLFFVREAWPSRTTGCTLTEASIAPGKSLQLRAEMQGILFGDGIESDHIQVRWGQKLAISRSERCLNLL